MSGSVTSSRSRSASVSATGSRSASFTASLSASGSVSPSQTVTPGVLALPIGTGLSTPLDSSYTGALWLAPVSGCNLTLQ